MAKETPHPQVNMDGAKELRKFDAEFKDFSQHIKDFNPFTGLEDVKPSIATDQSRLFLASGALYMRPVRSVNRPNFKTDKVDSRVFFDEKHRKQYDLDWEYVEVTIRHAETPGDSVDAWTGKWGCDPAHYWILPTQKLIAIPRHLAVQLSKCKYHRLVANDRPLAHSQFGLFTGGMAVDSIVERISVAGKASGF